MQTTILILFTIFLLFIIFWQASLLIASILGPPVVYSNKIAVSDCMKLAQAKKGDLIIDLGCGSARTLITAVRKFDGKGIGVDRSLYCYLRALMNVYLSGQQNNIKLYWGDFKKVEKYLKDTNIVYVYLFNSTLAQIEDWLFDHISSDTKVVSLAFQFKKHRPVTEIDTYNLRMTTKARLYRKK